MGSSISLTAGLMGGCSTLMFVEAVMRNDSYPMIIALLSTLSGFFTVHLIAKILDNSEEVAFLNLRGRNASGAIIIMPSMC